MNRREFLHASLSCAALAAPPIPIRAADNSTPKPRIPIGFFGATYSHGPDKIKLTLNSTDWEFVGVCETTPVERQACEKLGAKLISREELFQRARVVVVESDARDHAQHALLALQAGSMFTSKSLPR